MTEKDKKKALLSLAILFGGPALFVAFIVVAVVVSG